MLELTVWSWGLKFESEFDSHSKSSHVEARDSNYWAKQSQVV